MMRRLIVTGANGTGKSYIASILHAARPEIPLISYDAVKLTCDWQQKPRPQIDQQLSRIVATDAWILEGGPSLLKQALPRAEAIIWLDPPELKRAWRLLIRPWRNFGKTRAELPEGNIDWPIQQYKFAVQSLWNRSKFQTLISENLKTTANKQVWHCRSGKEIDAAVIQWSIGDKHSLYVESLHLAPK